MSESEEFQVARNCPECGKYDLRYYCSQCKVDLCYDCFCQWHNARKLYDHRFICICNNNFLIKLHEDFEKLTPKDAPHQQ